MLNRLYNYIKISCWSLAAAAGTAAPSAFPCWQPVPALVERKTINMEDRYKIITDISGDPSEAFFAVVYGHGGQAATDYVADN
ncbi:putative protein phosphatase 2C 32 [Bienertia sinuspersici]